MFGKVKLNRSQLARLLDFFGENSKKIFSNIENPVNQPRGFSSMVTHGTYLVKAKSTGIDFIITIDYKRVHYKKGAVPFENDRDIVKKEKRTIKKEIKF